MARNYGNIATAIWQDPDFIALSVEAQRLYMLLITQHDISSVGTLAITLRRWSRMASNRPMDCLSNDLAELEDKRFVALDWDNEELLVRTFVKWDGGHTNPKRLLSIRAAARAITSPITGPILAAELDSLGVEHGMTFSQVDSHSVADPMPTDPPRVVVTNVSRDSTTHTPQQTTRNTHSSADESAIAPATPTRTAYTRDFEEFWNHYPLKAGKIKAFAAWKTAIKKHTTSAVIILAARRMAQDPNLPDASFIPHPTTWLNRGGWDDPPFAPRGQDAKQSTTDQRVRTGLDLMARYAAKEAREEQQRLEIEA